MSKDFDNIYDRYAEMKIAWEKKRGDWVEIAKFVGITVDMNYINNQGKDKDNQRDPDFFVDDPTAAISVNQAGDYMLGIMWGTGEGVLNIKPSRYVLELVDEALVEDWYDFATDQTLYHMNHQDAGFSTAMRPYAYDQSSFGTSGIGAFKNNQFEEGIDDNALVFRNYGVDNTLMDEGKSGQPEIVAAVYNWKLNRIISEFCKTNGSVDDAKLENMPEKIKKAFKESNLNEVFQIVFMFFPREDYDPRLKGKRGSRYRGVWFMDDKDNGKIFSEESFRDRPIAMARAIKVRNETYGRAPGTLLISTIRSVNFLVSTAIDVVDKMSNPSLGVYSNAIFGDSVLDTSPNGLTIFNQTLAQAAGGNPVFPLVDVGDPSAIMQFIVPYLNEKITTAFKVDTLLDFSSANEMTATESLHRYAIRGKSLAGMLLQQKNEMLVPVAKRAIGILASVGELGVDPEQNKERAESLIKLNKQNRIIPDAVLQVMADGRPWYELEFNNELEKLVKTEAVQNLLQTVQAITAIAALNPEILQAVNWYKLLKAINDNLNSNSQILLSEDEFKEAIEQAAAARAEAMKLEAAQAGATIQRDQSQAGKSDAEAEKIQSGR